jgi:2-oxoisovalerate dehydrogenase E1 component
MSVKAAKSKVHNHLTKDTLLLLYKNFIKTRFLDQKMITMIKQGKSYFHIGSSGHEAIQTAMAYAMQPGYDWAYPYYRDLAFVLQYGVTPLDVLLNFLARADDPSSGGRQMPNHYGHRNQRIVTQSSPTGTQYLQAVGCALGALKEGKDEVVYVSSGEGTTAQGDFHEALNWASKDKLPVIFVIQNNKYAISVHIKEQVAGGSIFKLASGYEGLNRFKVDGTDIFQSYQIARNSVELARSGKGPSLIEADTVRLLPHSSSDSDKKYRGTEELEQDKKNDPMPKFESYLLKEKILARLDLDQLKRSIKEEIDQAAEKAETFAQPEKDSIMKFLYASEEEDIAIENSKISNSGENIVMVDAINHALKEEIELDEKIYLFGQDVADDKGGVFTATTGISSRFGKERCFNAPLAESSIVGVAIGMAIRGLKPVIEIQFGDYIWTAMMQIRNELSTIRWRSNNSWFCPVVIRVPVGGYIHGGLCHSQNIEGFFSHIPGIRIVYPSRADDAKGLLKTAIRSMDPILFLEHKGLYRQSYAAAPEPDKNYLLPFGKAAVRLEGEDVTIVTYGALVQKSLEAAKHLQKEGYSIEIIDLRTITPLDIVTVIQSLKKTNKVLVAHEDNLFQGFGAEIVSQISEYGFEYLDAPVKRIAAKDIPIGFSPIIENATLPQTSDIIYSLQELLSY